MIEQFHTKCKKNSKEIMYSIKRKSVRQFFIDEVKHDAKNSIQYPSAIHGGYAPSPPANPENPRMSDEVSGGRKSIWTPS